MGSIRRRASVEWIDGPRTQACEWENCDGLAGYRVTEADRSPFVEVQCSCGAQQHFHETDIKKVPIDADIGSPCTGCGELLVFDAGVIPSLFARLRREGWII